MILRGLLVAAAGFVFIFSPGVPIGLLARRRPPLRRELIYWGIGLWPAALLPSLFVQSLLRPVLLPDPSAGGSTRPADYALALLGALLTALFGQAALYLVLRRRVPRGSDEDAALTHGLPLGFGMGLIAQVFTGLSLVGAGFRLMFADIATPTLASLAQIGWLDLIVQLLALVMFRPALLVVSAARGVLAGRAAGNGLSPLALAVLIDAGFVWAAIALQWLLGQAGSGQVMLGETQPGVAIAVLLYYALAFGLAYGWLQAQLARARHRHQTPAYR